LDTSYAETAF